MADGNRTVTVQQQHAHRLADDIRAADHDALLALRVDLVLVEQLHDTRGRARHEIKIADHDLADINRMERVHVLLRINGVDDRLLGNMLRHRHLAQDARNCRALVQLCNQTEQFLLRGLFGKRVLLAVKAALLAGALLIADVNLARRIVADDNNRQTRRYTLLFQRLGLCQNAAAHLRRQCLAVHSYCTHIVVLLYREMLFAFFLVRLVLLRRVECLLDLDAVILPY